MPDTPVPDARLHAYASGVPVIVGHCWETGTPTILGSKVACVDYSAGKGGSLVATSGAARPNSSTRNSSRTADRFALQSTEIRADGQAGSGQWAKFVVVDVRSTGFLLPCRPYRDTVPSSRHWEYSERWC
jgi:hypothetical protein